MTLPLDMASSDFQKCVAGALLPIFCQMFNEQQERVVMNKYI
jgi:hypothetical protein